MITVPELSYAMCFSLMHFIRQNAASQMTSHLQMELLLKSLKKALKSLFLSLFPYDHAYLVSGPTGEVWLQNGRAVFQTGKQARSKQHFCLGSNAQTRKYWSLSSVTHPGLQARLNRVLLLAIIIFRSSAVLKGLAHLFPPKELQQIRSEK